MAKIVVNVEEEVVRDIRQYAREFKSMTADECYDFNDETTVNDLRRFCNFILRRLPASKRRKKA